jgi:tetratricopeptide (TPR) repeat protein
MTDQIFISYRRDDAAYVTGHINDLLRKEFGNEAVFTDVDNIALGVDFRAVLDQTVSQCQVLLAVIGTEWLTVSDQDGRSRLEDPADFVRIEIESALKRDVPVIPLLVSGAKMPAAEDLPESLRGFAFRNGTQIRPAPDFNVDMARLIKNLQRHFDEIRTEATTDPIRDRELNEERSPAEVDVQQDSPSKRSGSSEISVQVGEEERARRQAELGIGHDETKKRWTKRLGLIAIVVLAGASWYYVDRIQETTQAVLTPVETAIFETEENLDASDDAEANRTDDTDSMGEVEVGPPTSLPAAAMDDAIFEPVPETESNTVGETSDQPDANLEAVTDATAVLSAEADAVDEIVADAEAGPAASNDTATDTGASEFIGEGVRLAAIGEHEAAIQNFDEAIRLDEERSFVYKQRGASYKALGQYEAAITDYNEAIRLNGEDVNAYYNRGVSQYALQDYAAAIADFDVVIQSDPEFVNAYSRRADAHEAMGNVEAAARDRAVVAEF